MFQSWLLFSLTATIIPSSVALSLYKDGGKVFRQHGKLFVLALTGYCQKYMSCSAEFDVGHHAISFTASAFSDCYCLALL